MHHRISQRGASGSCSCNVGAVERCTHPLHKNFRSHRDAVGSCCCQRCNIRCDCSCSDCKGIAVVIEALCQSSWNIDCSIQYSLRSSPGNSVSGYCSLRRWSPVEHDLSLKTVCIKFSRRTERSTLWSKDADQAVTCACTLCMAYEPSARHRPTGPAATAGIATGAHTILLRRLTRCISSVIPTATGTAISRWCRSAHAQCVTKELRCTKTRAVPVNSVCTTIAHALTSYKTTTCTTSMDCMPNTTTATGDNETSRKIRSC